MQPLDNDFFEEYKRLDRLCGDMYACQNGVSAYLAAMESKAAQGQARVACWNSDYRMLKHVRWVRNQIAHDSGNCQLSEPSDLAFVQDFYSRIFSGQDALTLLRKANEHAQRRTQPQTQYATSNTAQTSPHPFTTPERNPPQTPVQPPNTSNKWLVLSVAIVILLLAAILLFGR